jgi:hypothetical protein
MIPEAFGRTIQLFLVDGTPTGLRKATIHGWDWPHLRRHRDHICGANREARAGPNRYLHPVRPDAEAVGGTRAYVGSANSVRERIKQSAQQREFWETAIAVTTSDDDLSRGTLNIWKRD